MKDILTEAKEAFQRLYGNRLNSVVLFGSQAREDSVPGSDIDLLIVLHGEVEPGKEITRSSHIAAAISLKYDVVLSRTFVSLSRYNIEQSPLFLNIHKEGVVV